VEQQNQLAATVLETGAAGLGSAATLKLLEKEPGAGSAFGKEAWSLWKTHFGDQALELASALRAGQPELFTRRVRWHRSAFAAREVPETLLLSAMRALREVVQEELPPQSAGTAISCLDAAINDFESAPEETPQTMLDTAIPAHRIAARYVEAVLDGDARAAMKLVLDAVAAGTLDTRSACLDVLVPAQQEFGLRWHLGKLGIAEEHLGTATTQRLLTLLTAAAERPVVNGKTVVVAGVAGDPHDMGVRLLADFLELAGWNNICLGGDVPPGEIARAVHVFGADLLVLSATLGRHIERVKETIAALGSREDDAVKVLVGGHAFTGSGDLWRTVGADGYGRSADEAVSLARDLVGLNAAES
jgi:methanogenic corrinoid protein MtbC1